MSTTITSSIASSMPTAISINIPQKNTPHLPRGEEPNAEPFFMHSISRWPSHQTGHTIFVMRERTRSLFLVNVCLHPSSPHPHYHLPSHHSFLHLHHLLIHHILITIHLHLPSHHSSICCLTIYSFIFIISSFPSSTTTSFPRLFAIPGHPLHAHSHLHQTTACQD